jgi:acetoin utilization deacetylase AcuC-like enzyme
MEGGYNLSALASSVAAHVDVLMQDMSPKIKNTPKSPGL